MSLRRPGAAVLNHTSFIEEGLMTKIAIIGAGGYVFPFRLMGDLLSFPELREATIALMDIDADRLERTAGGRP